MILCFNFVDLDAKKIDSNICNKTDYIDYIDYFLYLSHIGLIDYTFPETDIIGFCIEYNRLYRLGSGQQSVISIMHFRKAILSVSVSVIIGYIDYVF